MTKVTQYVYYSIRGIWQMHELDFSNSQFKLWERSLWAKTTTLQLKYINFRSANSFKTSGINRPLILVKFDPPIKCIFNLQEVLASNWKKETALIETLFAPPLKHEKDLSPTFCPDSLLINNERSLIRLFRCIIYTRF